MNGIKDENFYTVLGWMLNVLGLKGNELIVFAIIYSFSQDGESEFKGSISYLQTFGNIKSPQTVFTVLEELERNKKYIKSREFTSGRNCNEPGNIKRKAYSVNFETINQIKQDIALVKGDNHSKN